jgi:hypothetical protein
MYKYHVSQKEKRKKKRKEKSVVIYDMSHVLVVIRGKGRVI